MFRKLGFTMIELLIVIAVLGILAVAVLSAINPIEQINRGKDTGSRSDAEQTLSAIDRFYASQGYYPWQTGAGDSLHEPIAWQLLTDAADTTTPTPVTVLAKLSTGGTSELKTSFVNRISPTTYNPLYIYNGGAQGNSTYVCFTPNSGSFQTEAVTRCGTAGAGLPADLAGAAASVCATGAEMICLP
ncbi:MAG: type II secretion system protein [Microgenomates group bacterium]